ncbi:MAG: tRNA (N(6)-L-threonylcarbamoyladenosine(37)-C(2))-methylthiotransferase MtaB [Gammaproteobacteria bacterium]
MNIHLKTLGCRLNEAELETWAQAFQQSGHHITTQIEAAQLIVLNTCAVTHDAARKSRQLIRRIHRGNPRAKLVVSGCYATLNQSDAEAEMGVDLVVGNKDKDRLVEKALAELNLDTMPAMSTEPGEVSLFTRGRQRAFVKVQDGCRYRCTFCIVTVARGEEKSRPVREVIDEINALHRQHIDEIVLTGVHLGGYGGGTSGVATKDAMNRVSTDLTGLVKAVLAETGISRLRLGSLEPWELSDEFFSLFDNPRLMPHLHLPLQSGSDSVLRRMARRCKTQEFSAIVNRLRERIPHFNVTTDIIVGFPGETEQEWQESVDFIEKTGFGHIHIFTYSRRSGTKAATLPDQLPDEIKKRRSRSLHGLAESMKQQFNRNNLGNEFPVLWEGYSEPFSEDKKRVYGYTQNYLRVGAVIDRGISIENRIIRTRLTGLGENCLIGELMK